VWLLLSFLARRAQSPSIPLAIAMTCAGASVTVMLSGYATGGQNGLPLAAALTGATIASLGLANPALLQGLVSIGVVGLFSLVVIGRFFGDLTTLNACLLFFAPLLCWFAELPIIRKRGTFLQFIARIGLTAIPAGLALFLAVQTFMHPSAPPSPANSDLPQP